MDYPQDWGKAQEKLQSLYPDKAVRTKILGKLLNMREVNRRLEYFQEEDEVVRGLLEDLLTQGGPLTCGTLDPVT